MDKNKEPIRASTWVIVSIVVIFIAGYFGYQIYQGFQQQKIELENANKQQQDLLSEQQQELDQTKQQITDMANSQKTAEAEAQQAQEKLQEASNNPDLSSIVSEWEPLVGLVYCEYRYSDTNYKYAADTGSGVVIKFSNQPISIMTNKHVVTDESGYSAYACGFDLPNHDYVYKNYENAGNWQGLWFSGNDDGALVYADNADDYITHLTNSFPKLCDSKPLEGDKIVILGYPAIGSTQGVTVTQGIISGFEGNYFITDAKIDAGNSGGAAILVKDDCLLGLPTYGVIGKAESLGRILDVNIFLEK